jgi:predicted aldo/keto reductase-like oxidoreductase
MNRRLFLQKSIQGSAFLSALSILGCAESGEKDTEPLPKRRLGQTGEKLSIIGFGGIVVRDMPQEKANNIVNRAWDHGVNYYDVAPTYGNAEERLGPALKPYRKESFLACKTQKRKKAEGLKELNQSLKTLQTDYFDLYQLHALTTVEDVETAFAPGGIMEGLVKAKAEGKIRHIGFSAHSEKAALMAMNQFDFDSVLFPINYICWFEGNFGPRVVAKAKEKNMGILALKAMAFTRVPEGAEKPFERLWYIPIGDDDLARQALKFSLSQGTTAAIPPGDEQFFFKAISLVQNLGKPTEEEEKVLQHNAKGIPPLFKSEM